MLDNFHLLSYLLFDYSFDFLDLIGLKYLLLFLYLFLKNSLFLFSLHPLPFKHLNQLILPHLHLLEENHLPWQVLFFFDFGLFFLLQLHKQILLLFLKSLPLSLHLLFNLLIDFFSQFLHFFIISNRRRFLFFDHLPVFL